MCAADLTDQLVEAWGANCRINEHLIKHISDEGLKCTLSQRGGRNVVRQFAHLQYVRAYQLQKRAKPLAGGVRIFETDEEPDRRTLLAALRGSQERIEQWLRLASAPEQAPPASGRSSAAS